MTKIRSRGSSRIRDVRGRGGRGGGGGSLGDLLGGSLGGGRRGGGMPIPMPTGGGGPGCSGGLLKGGGGMMMLLLFAAVFILPKLMGGGLSGLPGSALTPTSSGAGSAETTGGDDDPCSSELEQILCGATDDVADYWVEQLPLSFGTSYVETQTVFFSGAVSTGCGQASAQTGPFYCPLDQGIYFDLDFLVALQDRFGATGDLAAQYIVAHEYGHHVQNVLGINEEMREAQRVDPQRANQYSIALELQADCFAGAWVYDVDRRGLLDDDDEITEALEAAAAVGDDRIQQQTSGRVDPESWTHGSSAQRVQWFQRGFQTGDPRTCNTFAEIM